MNLLVHGVTVWLFLIGIYGIVTSRNMIHMVGCITVAKSATAVLLVSIGYRHDAQAPIRDASDIALETLPAVVDPVVQALMLIDVVVNAAITALLLALAVQFQRRAGNLDPRSLGSLRK